MKIRIGTRRSKLAMWQAYYVEERLKAGGLETEIIPIDTKGDKILDVTIAKIGSKGVFTEEIEAQLAEGTIDIAVHSAKDMQSELPQGFEIIAFTEREQVNDVLISLNPGLRLSEKADFIVGTSSTRRIALLKHYCPNVKTVDMRGNLQTRMQKLEAGHCDAMILAYAGVKRMAYQERIAEHLDITKFTPPVGQGSVAIEVATGLDDEKKAKLKALLEHNDSAVCLRAERAYLKRLQGGCSIPTFANARLEGETISLDGGIISLDGKNMVRLQMQGQAHDPEALGLAFGEKVLSEGGAAILEGIRRSMNH